MCSRLGVMRQEADWESVLRDRVGILVSVGVRSSSLVDTTGRCVDQQGFSTT